MQNLKIYFTSDVHGYVFPTDYTDKEKKNLGLLNIMSNFEKDGNTLIIDGGDTIQGSSFTTFIKDNNFEVNPMSKVMNAAKYDYITLGNHDFNYGYDYLMSYLNNLDAKCLCCNVEDNKVNSILTHDIKVMENGLRIGIIGFTTDYINVWEKKENLTNFEIKDTFSSLEKIHSELKGNVDILIGVYHGGFEYDLDTNKKLSSSSENIAYKICNSYNFDILLTGHQHMPIEGRNINNTYIVQTPFNGTKYIELNASFNNGKIQEINSSLKTPFPKNSNETELYSELLEIEEKVQEWLSQPVGTLDMPLEIKEHIVMAQEGSILANFVNTLQLEVSGADISCTSLGNHAKGLNKEISVRDIVAAYVYPNTLVVLDIDGKTLKRALERCASYFNKTGDQITVSDSFLKPKVEHYNYDYFSNIDYSFDLDKEIGQRVTSVKFKGKEIQDTDSFKIVMNNYRATGAGGYDFYKDSKIIKDIQINITDLIIEYFQKHKNITIDKKKYLSLL